MFALICSTVISVVGTICKVVGAIKIVASAINALAKALGLVDEKQNVEDLGDKSIQAEEEGIKPENYASFEEYKNALDNFEINPEKSKTISTEDKIRRGLEVSAMAIKDKYPTMELEKLIELYTVSPMIFSEKRFSELGKIAVDDPKIVDNIVGYINGSEHNDEVLTKAENVLTNMEKSENPKLSDEDALIRILSLRS